MVKTGKKPFYLKKSDVKKQALVKKFEGMKGKDRDKAIERRRRKLAGRERRNMPHARRA
jgi:ribosomal RNA-processing protein 36